MVNNLKCDLCSFAVKCAARAKLKPFLEEARTDLGVELDFVSCNDYKPFEDEEEELPANPADLGDDL